MKKLFAILLALALSLALGTAALAAETVKIGATLVPHAEVLNFLKPLLAAKGFDLQVVEFTDYVLPNTATESGELNANYFQHKPYLTDFNTNNGTHLVPVIPVHFEPLALYPGKTATLDAIADGAKIAVPNDTTNEARALLLLQAAGIIKVDESKGLEATKLDIIENPKNIEIVEIEAAQLPRTLADVDLAVINGNYALEAGLSATKDGVAIEAVDSLAAETYINYVVVKEGNEGAPFIAAIQEVLADPAVKAFFEETYKGAVIPAF
ncbi:MAG: metal ABC transporter substrate-binding protein [Oscillospiraceae bacterium]|jgi:D-methionine transport system substrate-binding protein|nr:metal ABC transporter substrate-binding protein [Oscillospiraceae bacterium]